jgi:hypothetical protein
MMGASPAPIGAPGTDNLWQDAHGSRKAVSSRRRSTPLAALGDLALLASISIPVRLSVSLILGYSTAGRGLGMVVNLYILQVADERCPPSNKKPGL